MLTDQICYRCDYRPVAPGKRICPRCLEARERLRAQPRVPCRHQCGRTVTAIRAKTHRGLCWTCFTTLAIRDLYPPRQARHVDHLGDLRMPRTPTAAPPGSEAKIEVMCERAARGERLFHPGDARDWTRGGALGG